MAQMQVMQVRQAEIMRRQAEQLEEMQRALGKGDEGGEEESFEASNGGEQIGGMSSMLEGERQQNSRFTIERSEAALRRFESSFHSANSNRSLRLSIKTTHTGLNLHNPSSSGMKTMSSQLHSLSTPNLSQSSPHSPLPVPPTGLPIPSSTSNPGFLSHSNYDHLAPVNELAGSPDASTLLNVDSLGGGFAGMGAGGFAGDGALGMEGGAWGMSTANSEMNANAKTFCASTEGLNSSGGGGNFW